MSASTLSNLLKLAKGQGPYFSGYEISPLGYDVGHLWSTALATSAPAGPPGTLPFGKFTDARIDLRALFDLSTLWEHPVRDVLPVLWSEPSFLSYTSCQHSVRKACSWCLKQAEFKLTKKSTVSEGMMDLGLVELCDGEWKCPASIFGVPKGCGTKSRGIVDPRINDYMDHTADSFLPSILSRLESFHRPHLRYGVTLDMVSAFHQFLLSKEIRPFFTSRMKGGAHFWNTTLPMGYRNAVSICQGTLGLACLEARYRVEARGIAPMSETDSESWVDNGVLLGSSVAVVQALLDAFREVADELGLAWEQEIEVGHTLKWVGLDIDLASGKYTYAGKWTEKVRPLLEIATQAPACGSTVFAKLAGIACYMCYISRSPMIAINGILRELAVMCKSLKGGKSGVVELGSLHSEFRYLLGLLGSSWKLQPPRAPPRQVIAFTDASDTYYGLVLMRGRRCLETTVRIREVEQHITWKELMAVLVFLRKYSRLSCCTLKLGIDNMAALACIMKKHTMSSNLAPVL